MQPVGKASSYAVDEHCRKNNEARRQFAAFLNKIQVLPLETELTAAQKAQEEENRKIAAAFVLLYADRGMSPVSVIKAYITRAYGAEITTDPYNEKAKALLAELPKMTAWPEAGSGYFNDFNFPAEFSFSGDVNQLQGSASWRVLAVESSDNIYSQFLAHAYSLNPNVFTAHPTDSAITLEIIWQQLPSQKRVELCQGHAKARLPGFAFNWLKEKSFYQLHYAEKETSLLAGLSDSDFHINFAYGSLALAAFAFEFGQTHISGEFWQSTGPMAVVGIVMGLFYWGLRARLNGSAQTNDAGKQWGIDATNTGIVTLLMAYFSMSLITLKAIAGLISSGAKSFLSSYADTLKSFMPVFYGFLSLVFAGRQLYKIVLKPMADECLSTSAPKAASAWLTVGVTLGVAAAVIVPLLVFAPAALPFLASHAYILPVVVTLISPLLRCEAVRTRPWLAAAIRGVVMGALLLSMTASTLYIAASFLSSNVLLGVKGAALAAALSSGPFGWIVLAVVFFAVLATVYFSYNKPLVNLNSGKGMAVKFLSPIPLSGAAVSDQYRPDLGAPKPESLIEKTIEKATEKFGGGRNNSSSELASRPANLKQPSANLDPQSPQEAATTTR
jgi:hypothetical protein